MRTRPARLGWLRLLVAVVAALSAPASTHAAIIYPPPFLIAPVGLSVAPDPAVMFNLGGSFAASGSNFDAIALRVGPTITGVAGTDLYGVLIAATLVEPGSGASAILAGLNILPFITAGGATFTNAAGINIAGFTAASGTTNASGLRIVAAPTGASNNYSLWVVAGTSRFAGDIQFANSNSTAVVLGAIGSTCPAVTCTAAYTWEKGISSDGSVVYFPLWK